MKISKYFAWLSTCAGAFLAAVNMWYSSSLIAQITFQDEAVRLDFNVGNSSGSEQRPHNNKSETREINFDIDDNSDEKMNHTKSDVGRLALAGEIVTGQPEKDYTQEEYISNEYRNDRINHYDSWFEGDSNSSSGGLLPNADKDGPILDFAIIGFPKCGTTTVEANLGLVAPLPISDVCTPIHQTVYYAYHNWPRIYGNNETKVLRGTKCPAFINDDWLIEWSTYLPKTKLILGIRHPVLWFQSFWNMQAGNRLTEFAKNDPYSITKPCQLSPGRLNCRNDCPGKQLFCTQRASFHIPMARLGKTLLSEKERQLLSAKTYPLRAGMNLENHNITNPIFVYELTELNEDYIWDEMADFLQFPGKIPHPLYKSSHGRHPELEIDFCDEKYDSFRALMMPDSYDLSTWLQEYFIPLAKDKSRTDVVIPRHERFHELVEAYKVDPCKRLIRLQNGTFVIPNNDSNMTNNDSNMTNNSNTN